MNTIANSNEWKQSNKHRSSSLYSTQLLKLFLCLIFWSLSWTNFKNIIISAFHHLPFLHSSHSIRPYVLITRNCLYQGFWSTCFSHFPHHFSQSLLTSIWLRWPSACFLASLILHFPSASPPQSPAPLYLTSNYRCSLDLVLCWFSSFLPIYFQYLKSK